MVFVRGVRTLLQSKVAECFYACKFTWPGERLWKSCRFLFIAYQFDTTSSSLPFFKSSLLHLQLASSLLMLICLLSKPFCGITCSSLFFTTTLLTTTLLSTWPASCSWRVLKRDVSALARNAHLGASLAAWRGAQRTRTNHLHCLLCLAYNVCPLLLWDVP
jgi:hypothetical protein